MKKLQKIGLSVNSFILICLIIVFFAHGRIIFISSGHIFEMGDIAQLQKCQDVVVLGAGVRDNGSMSPILRERAITARQLYKQGVACRIIVSGYKAESKVMKEYFIKEGIPKNNIETDNFGIDTFTSMRNIKNNYIVDNLVIVTQDFHLPRAVYIARMMGINANGMIAQKIYPYIMLEEYKYIIRDWLASVKAVGQVEIIKN